MQTIAPSSTLTVESFSRAGTIQDRFLRDLNEPMRLLVVSTRHGIGGSITDNTHVIPIAEALGHSTKTNVIGASPLGYQNLDITFHHGCFKEKVATSSLDPLKSLDPTAVRAILAQVRPHVVLMLDAPSERSLMEGQPLSTKELLDSGVRCVIAATDAVPLSGFWAIKKIEVVASRSVSEIDLYPGVAHSAILNQANIYLESDKIARLFGATGTPTQHVTSAEKQLAREALHDLGVSDSDKIIYIHAGTSTPLKELTPAQSSELIRRSRRELVRAGENLSDLTFVVSPEPLARPETAATIMRCIAKLGGHAVLAPTGSFGLFRGLIANSDAVICADTAAGHLANALNVPCAALYGNPDPSVPITLWGPDPLRSVIPNTVIARIHSNSTVAQERFGSIAGHSPQQMSDAEFVVGVIVAAAIEGWGATNRKV